MIPHRAVVAAAIAVIVGIPVLTFALVVSPLQQQADSNDATRAAVEGANAAQSARNGDLQRSGSRISALDRQAAALDAALPSKPQIAALLAEVGAMSHAADVKVVSFTSGGMTPPAGPVTAGGTPAPAASSAPTPAQGTPTTATSASTAVAQVAVNMQVSGTQDGVRDFIGAFQRAKRVVGVSSVSLTQDSTGVVTGTIVASAYVLPLSGAAGAPVPSSAPQATGATVARAAAQ